MKTLSLRDVAFLASTAPTGPTPPIDEDDANTWGWWSVDQYAVEVGGGDYTVQSWGNRMNTQVDKTDITDSTNFTSYPSLSGQRPVISRNDNLANLLVNTHSIVPATWAVSNATKNSATLLTFTAQNGLIQHTLYNTRAGVNYQLRMKIRNVTGNTGIQWYHLNSGTGTSTALTIDGVLTQYSVTFLGHATGGAISVGLRDHNAAGWGQIEMTEMQLIEATWSTTYVENASAQPMFPKIDDVRLIWTGLDDYYLWHNYSGTHAAISDPLTMYLLWRPMVNIGAGVIMTSVNPAWEVYMDLNANDESIYVNQAPFARIDTGAAATPGTWRVTTMVYNAGSSEVRVNKTAAVTGALGAAGLINKGFYLGGDAFGGTSQPMGVYEFLIRTVADNTATQDTFIDYLAARVGLVV